ncbi:hypothetical protein PMSM_05560 [Paenibacillus macquariensis subsp. macquariensis]|uniref:Uncharacterized protein n=2 Tax=Paenibacillus macquariensis TaxID=948756 RepID=A0ABY1JQ04_9BACL|nr:hypothetical protein PMSM_05560 [Paenibacillus macquariensis subsp. macquariensis]SIQ55554.1 hypothetical protein SAMN05421578_102545 [Paenibacillus macquariensis]
MVGSQSKGRWLLAANSIPQRTPVIMVCKSKNSNAYGGVEQRGSDCNAGDDLKRQIGLTPKQYLRIHLKTNQLQIEEYGELLYGAKAGRYTVLGMATGLSALIFRGCSSRR